MALRIPSDDKPPRINFMEACHLICQLEPALNILAVADALKTAITKKALPAEDVPALYVSDKSEWVAGLYFSDPRVFHPGGGGALFAPTFQLEHVLSVFAGGGEEEVAATLERSKSILAGFTRFRGHSAPETQTVSSATTEHRAAPKPIARAELRAFLEQLPLHPKEEAE
jgi:hypothetical protein